MRQLTLLCCFLTSCEAQIDPGGVVLGQGNGPGGSGGTGAGSTGGSGGSVDIDPCGPVVAVAAEPMRRLSHDEYKNTLSDLQPTWGATIGTQVSGFTPDTESLGFKNSAPLLNVSSTLAQQYMDAAEAISTLAVSNLTALLPCTPTAGNATSEAGCADQFIKAFGRRLYRHTLGADEVARYTTVYGSARTQGYDFKTGIQWVVFSFLQAPGFLYRVELDPPGAIGARPLTGLELASRLSYLLWQSAPDDTLLNAAEGGQLTNRIDINREATRLLADPKARRLVTFFDQWLRLGNLDNITRDPTKYPNLPTGLGAMLHTEAQTFAVSTVFDGDAKLSSLLTGQYSYLNQTLAQHYGISGITGTAFQRVALTGRGGLMMLGGNLAARDLSSRTSIVHRGVEVRTVFMCQTIAAPPPNVPALGPIDASLTQAQRLAAHRADPACASCHNNIDSLGTPFEGFDAVGRARTADELGNPIDTSGELVRSRDTALNGPVKDGTELMGKLSQSSEVSDCFATQLYRFSMGRQETTDDACSTYTLKKAFQDNGGDVKQLLLTLTQLDDFDHHLVQP
jgi:hypothetical protein